MATEKQLKKEKNERGFFRDLLIMLVPVAVIAWYYYGATVIKTMLICALAGVAAECVGAFLMKCKRSVSDFNSVFIGAAMALMLPADIPRWIALSGTLFAVLAVKLPLGGTFSSPFSPTAAGFSFVCLCWPQEVFKYPALGTGAEYVQGTSVAGMLSLNTSIRPNMINVFDLLTGNVPGPAGATCIVVLLGAAAFLVFRHPHSALSTAGFIAACAVMALLFPRVYARSERLTSLTMELCSGLIIFAAVFLVTDPATSPKRPLYRFLYGVFTGFVCMLLRYFGRLEESVCFALLVSDAVWPSIEKLLSGSGKKTGDSSRAGKESKANG